MTRVDASFPMAHHPSPMLITSQLRLMGEEGQGGWGGVEPLGNIEK
jgi:hypothetical protein